MSQPTPDALVLLQMERGHEPNEDRKPSRDITGKWLNTAGQVSR